MKGEGYLRNPIMNSSSFASQYSAGDITIQPKIGLNIASVGGDVDGDYIRRKTGLYQKTMLICRLL